MGKLISADRFLAKQTYKALNEIKEIIDFGIENLDGQELEDFVIEATKEVQALTKYIKENNE